MVATSKFRLLTIMLPSAARKQLFLHLQGDSLGMRKSKKDKHKQ